MRMFSNYIVKALFYGPGEVLVECVDDNQRLYVFPIKFPMPSDARNTIRPGAAIAMVLMGHYQASRFDEAFHALHDRRRIVDALNTLTHTRGTTGSLTIQELNDIVFGYAADAKATINPDGYVSAQARDKEEYRQGFPEEGAKLESVSIYKSAPTGTDFGTYTRSNPTDFEAKSDYHIRPPSPIHDRGDPPDYERPPQRR